LAGRISKPIQALAGITNRIGLGEYDVEVPFERTDEIGELAASIKSMAQQRKRAEEALVAGDASMKYLLSNGLAVIYACELSPPYTISFVSDTVLERFGYDPAEIQGVPDFWTSRIHPLDQQSVLDGRAGLAETEGCILEYRFTHADGSYHWVRDELEMQRDPAGRRTEILGFLIDINDQKEVEEELRRHQKMESLEHLSGGIAHYLNNLLQPILVLSELTERKLPEGSKERENLAIIIRASQQARDLVNRIAMFSRDSAEEKEFVNIYQAVEEGVKLLRSSMPATVSIEAILEENIGDTFGDATQIQSVIMNMATNALHAFGSQAGLLEISLSPVRLPVQPNASTEAIPGLKAGNYAKIVVSDDGRGMDAEIMEKIFDPFFTTKAVGEGTGMGLATAHGIITSHGGTIRVSSELGVGTSFDIYLPLVDEEADKIDPGEDAVIREVVNV